jgi:uncharacterized DUF497 family protein
VIIALDSFCSINKHPDGDRFEYVGYSYLNKMLFVVTVEEYSKDHVRIISARKATKREVENYEKDKRI